MGCRGATPRPGNLFRVRYLGTTSLSLSRKQLSIGVLQRPLLELYSAARRRGDDHRRGPLTMNQQVDISDYGLVVAENEGETTVVTKVITPISNVTLWAAVRFHSKTGRKNSLGAAFVPIACSEGVVDPKWFVHLGAKQRFLVSLTHPSLFACVLRRVAAPKSFECHAFVCATAEDALTISSVLGAVKEQCGRMGAIAPFIEGNYYRGNPTNSDLVYTEDDTATDVTVPHSPLTLSSVVEYRKSDVLDEHSRLMSSLSDSTCVASECKRPPLPERNRFVSPRDVVTLNISGQERSNANRDTMTLSKTMDFGSESEAGWCSRWEPVPPPRRRPNKQISTSVSSRENASDQHWQEELSETMDFSSESDLSTESDVKRHPKFAPPSVTTDSEIDYRITNRRSLPLNRDVRTDDRITRVSCFNSTPETNWSDSNHSSHQFRSATIPRSKPKTKVIRWRAEESQKPSFLAAIKKFGVRSFGRAKSGTGRLIESFRTKFRRSKNKEVSISEDSAYDTPEVCLSPDGSASTRKVWKLHQEMAESSSGGHYVSSPNSTERGKQESSSGSNFEAPKGRRGPHRKRKKRRRRWQPGPRSSSDSGVEEYHSDYSDTLNSMQKSESELEHFATKVSMVNVEHGMSPDEFRQWSKTNMQEELGYIP